MKKIVLTLGFLLFSIQSVFCQNLVILHTSDVHGRLNPIEYRDIKSIAGVSSRAAYFKEIRSEEPLVLTLDSGDYYQGSIYYRLFKGTMSARLLPYISYDALTFGNHEFDNGVKQLSKLVKISKAPYISTNLKFKDPYLSRTVKPYMIKTIDNKKILILGVTTQELNNLSNASGVEVLDPVLAIKEAILKNPADKIFVISHCGIDVDKEIAIQNPKVDLIFGGHNHYFFKYPKKVGKTYIFADGEFGVMVGRVDYDLDEGFKNFEQVYMTNEKDTDPSIDKEMAKINEKLDRVKNLVIGNTSILLNGEQPYIESNQCELGKLVLKSMTQGVKKWDIVFENSGSIRVNRKLSSEITRADLLELLPYDNKVVSCELQGKYIKKILKKGSVPGRSYLQYISKVQKFEDEKYYTVITNSYVKDGKDGYIEFKNMKNDKILFPSQFKAMELFLKNNSPINNENLVF